MRLRMHKVCAENVNARKKKSNVKEVPPLRCEHQQSRILFPNSKKKAFLNTGSVEEITNMRCLSLSFPYYHLLLRRAIRSHSPKLLVVILGFEHF